MLVTLYIKEPTQIYYIAMGLEISRLESLIAVASVMALQAICAVLEANVHQLNLYCTL